MNTSPDFLITAAKMLLALGVTVGALLLVLKFTRGLAADRIGKPGAGMVRVLSSTPVGVKKRIALVEVPGAVLVLGITGESIALLSKIENPETLDVFKNAARAESAAFTSVFGFAGKVMHAFSESHGRRGGKPGHGDARMPDFRDGFEGARKGRVNSL